MIEKVHGLHATSMTLSDRFTILTEVATPRPRPRAPTPNRFHPGSNLRNQALIRELAWRLERQSKRNDLRQRLGLPYRQYDNNFGGMRRSNSFSNLSQASFHSLGWNSFGNMSRSASVNNLSQSGRPWRQGFRRRGVRRWVFKGKFRQRQGYFMPMYQQRWGAPRGVGRGFRGWGRGRGNNGGMRRNIQEKPVPSKEELDNQLDEYMASSKYYLDKELEEYMKTAEMEAE